MRKDLVFKKWQSVVDFDVTFLATLYKKIFTCIINITNNIIYY